MNRKLVSLLTLTLTLLGINTSYAASDEVNDRHKQRYIDSAKGFWLGQSIANWTGLVTEMDKVGTKETLPFYTDEDWGKKDLPAIWGEFVPHTDTIDFFLEPLSSVWGADDDTDIEYMYLHLYAKHQTTKLTAQQIADGWLTHTYSETDAPLFKKFPDSKPIQENFLWESNQRARELMAKGVLPPQTSEPSNNPKGKMIDAQLTTEIFGLLAYGNVDKALDIAELPIRVSAYGEAVDIARFYVAMYALSHSVNQRDSIKNQTQWLAHQARMYLPNNSYPAKMFDFIWAHYLANPNKSDWEATRDAVYQRYQVEKQDGYHYQDPFEAGINFAASLVSWFYGEGNLKRTIQIGSLTGWDSDNPTATWGGLLGFMLGWDKVVATFDNQAQTQKYWIHRTRRNFPDHLPKQKGEDTFSLMAERMWQVSKIILKQ